MIGLSWAIGGLVGVCVVALLIIWVQQGTIKELRDQLWWTTADREFYKTRAKRLMNRLDPRT